MDSFSRANVFAELGAIFKAADDTWTPEKCSKPELPACSKYAFFRSTIWCNGFHVSYGHYTKRDPIDGSWTELPILRLKFNPNKYTQSPVYASLMAWIQEHCFDGTLVRFDYAVDIPCRLDDLIVNSRKEPGLYKGTRYYGQRHQHGRVKIYDKMAEKAFRDRSDLAPDQGPVTRVEYTFCANRPIEFDRIVWLTRGPAPLPDVSEMSPQTLTLAKLLRDLRAAGGDVFQALGYLNYRTRKKIEPYVVGSGIQLLADGVTTLRDLLQGICDTLSIAYRSGGVNPMVLGRDSLPDWVELAQLEDPNQIDDMAHEYGYDYAAQLPV